MAELSDIISEADKMFEAKKEEPNGMIDYEFSCALNRIFDYTGTRSSDEIDKIRILFEEIIKAKKNIDHGFYAKLGERKFSFCGELLKLAIFQEHRLLNDIAFKHYVAVSVRYSEIPEDTAEGLLKSIPDYRSNDYVFAIQNAREAGPKQRIYVPDELKETLLEVLKERPHHGGLFCKAACAVVYLNIKEAVPILEEIAEKKPDDPTVSLCVLRAARTAFNYMNEHGRRYNLPLPSPQKESGAGGIIT